MAVLVYGQEPFTMHTPIGSRLRSWLAHWECETCGLMYSPTVMVDPRIDQRRQAEIEAERATEAEGRLAGIPTDVTETVWLEADADGEYPPLTLMVMSGDFQDVTFFSDDGRTFNLSPDQMTAIARQYLALTESQPRMPSVSAPTGAAS